mmetsp:Transcript_155943/g.499973  ORF Transcript_155943/g.499973 Transcript_155943/m.499973 type:complete len:728 (+) Transcript_155943:145-2328(+)
MADPCEVFIGGLPKEPHLLPAVEEALKAALAEFASGANATRGAADDGASGCAIRVRLHTAPKNGFGFGYAFAWLPSPEVAAALVAGHPFCFQFQGQTVISSVRAARGRNGSRAPPPEEPMAACLSVVAFTNLDRAAVTATAEGWQALLRPWHIGLEFSHFDLPNCGAVDSAEVTSSAKRVGDGVVAICFEPGQISLQSATDDFVVRLATLGRPLLVVSGDHQEADDTRVGLSSGVKYRGAQNVDVVGWSTLASYYPSCRSGGRAACASAFVAVAVRRAVAWHLTSKLKVFVCDCDQTLWGGVVGEDGVENLDMGGPHGMLQEKVSELQMQGRLVCLASRNDEADVFRVFDERAGCMKLRRSQLAAWQVHWGSKAASLRRLAAELHLGLDAFVFLDDNPGESECVRAALPEVLAVTVPGGNAEAFESLLRHHWALDLWQGSPATAEDLLRTQMYRENAQRKVVRRQAPSFEEYLRSLNLQVEMRSPETALEFARVTQLSQRSNKMNSTQLRFSSEAALREWVDVDGRWIIATWVSDRFGDYGLVGCALCSPGVDAVIVECFNLSCRVLHRGVEEALLRRVAEEAQDLGLDKVLVPLVETPRNKLMRDFLARVAAWAEVPCFTEGQPVAFGRSGARRGTMAPAMEVGAAKLRDLQGKLDAGGDEEGEGDEGGDDKTEIQETVKDGQEVSAGLVSEVPAVDWSAVLAKIAEVAEDIPVVHPCAIGGQGST